MRGVTVGFKVLWTTVVADASEESCDTGAAMALVEGEFCIPDLSEEEDDMADFELPCCDNTVLRDVAGAIERVVD